jgi:alpha/beta superfamily hydrolase
VLGDAVSNSRPIANIYVSGKQGFDMRKVLTIIFGVGIISYLGLYFYFYSTQGDRFKSVKLSSDFKFKFDEPFEELNFKSKDGGQINSLFFKRDSSRGVICFWKGNGGTLDRWGLMAPMFLKCNYDIIITDYRQHGKSTGEITLDNFYSDSQTVYDFLKSKYPENKIVIVGYSLGTSIASHLAIDNNPLMTILIEPRENFVDKYLDAFFLPLPRINKFSFRTDLNIPKTKSEIAIISGTKSDLHRDALELKKLLKSDDQYFDIKGATHQTILGDEKFEKTVYDLLNGTASR